MKGTRGVKMPKSAIRQTQPDEGPIYDVAISFLVVDEGTAGALASALEASGLKVFFFPKKQEELAGSDGLDSLREPFLKARVAVALFREPWGKTNWTRVEESAIKDRCLELGWQSLQFVMLDKKQQHPRWLPNTHIRYNYEDYGLDQIVGAIKRAVQEQGGVLLQPDAMTEAKRVKRQADYLQERESLLHDRRWIENYVHRSIAATYKRLEELAGQMNKEHGFQIVIGSQGYQACIMRAGYITLGIHWQQPIYNSVTNDGHGDCYLRVAEFSGSIPIPGRNEMSWNKPELLKEHRFAPDVSENRELVWIEGSKERVAHEKLADRIIMILLGLIERMNAGKVPRPSL